MIILSKFHSFFRFQKIKHWYQTYERLLLPLTLVVGVGVDAFTFQKMNVTSTFVLLGVYFFVISAALLFIQSYDAHQLSRNRFNDYIRLALPLVLQFLFGALLSGVFIFYFFSGTFFVSWPLLVLLIGLMISNDVFKKYYARVSIQIGVYYFLLFSLLSISLAFLTESISPKIFFLSGCVSLIFMFGFVELLFFANNDIRKFRLRISLIILSIFSFLNILYLAKIIPPIPLSIREMSLSHSVERTENGYEITVEKQPFFETLFHPEVFHKAKGESIYLYTAIFAPQKLQTKIIHEWKYFNEVKNAWETKSELSFSLSGGRKEGFRGYSFKNSVQSGKWRVYVKTERGEVLGRMSFVVEEIEHTPVLYSVIK